jgi:hypothetical protein
MNISLWANEGYHMAKSNAYNITEFSRPTEEYITTNYNVVEKQLALGGYRLA